jgi:ribonuclease HI
MTKEEAEAYLSQGTPKSSSSSKKKFYAVRKGHNPGIYTSAAKFNAQIKGFAGYEGKSFSTQEEAEAYLNKGKAKQEAKQPTNTKKLKFYAVRKGHHPGIYTSFEDVQKQITGFSYPEWKTFKAKDAAEAFLAEGLSKRAVNKLKKAVLAAQQSEQASNDTFSELQLVDPVELAKKHPELSISGPYAFVDGSFNEKTKLAGYGVILCVDGVQMRMSGICQDPHGMRNITGELMAAKVAAQYATFMGLKSLTIFHDFDGIAGWGSGTIEPKKPGAAEFVVGLNELKAQYGLTLAFVHVYGHTGVEHNETVDQLAKRAVGVKIKSTFM